MRIVLDTNVVVSAIFFGGKPREVIDLLMNNSIEVLATKEIIDEYKETIEELISKYPQKSIALPFTNIVSKCEIIEGKTTTHLCRDPDDDKFISCALDGKCIFIVSGDKDLLSINQYKSIKILTAAQFLREMV